MFLKHYLVSIYFLSNSTINCTI